MPKRVKKAAVDLDEDVKVGEGDDTIREWYEGFDVIDEIQRCFFDQPFLRWQEIEAELAQYPEFVGHLMGWRKKSFLRCFKNFQEPASFLPLTITTRLDPAEFTWKLS